MNARGPWEAALSRSRSRDTDGTGGDTRKASGGDVADDFADDDEESEGERIKRAGGFGDGGNDKVDL